MNAQDVRLKTLKMQTDSTKPNIYKTYTSRVICIWHSNDSKDIWWPVSFVHYQLTRVVVCYASAVVSSLVHVDQTSGINPRCPLPHPQKVRLPSSLKLDRPLPAPGTGKPEYPHFLLPLASCDITVDLLLSSLWEKELIKIPVIT
uniref:Uncharacterized protein n=1 Tax=Anguilla anguilla TaxID=7936 RepID=A0A0E9WRG2_ANGAN